MKTNAVNTLEKSNIMCSGPTDRKLRTQRKTVERCGTIANGDRRQDATRVTY